MDKNGNGLAEEIWTGHRDFPLFSGQKVRGVGLNECPGEFEQTYTIPFPQEIKSEANYNLNNQ
jgi:hypothetical protein